MILNFTEEKIADVLKDLEGWTVSDDRKHIEKTYKFKDFQGAWAFMSQVALIAEKSDHHPAWSNVYDTVSIKLGTHETGGITEKDHKMARAIESAFVFYEV